MGISAKQVKELRDRTTAGMMSCRKALEASDGDIEKAIEWLRTQGIAKAAKRAGRHATQGLVVPYIHTGGKLGVLVEVNCETDFVARTDEFKTLAHEISMQIAAAAPLAVSREELPKELIEKEYSIYLEQAKESGKPEKIWERIATGKMEKFYKESCLLEQVSIRDTSRVVDDMVRELSGNLGENIVVRRFIRFQIGE